MKKLKLIYKSTESSIWKGLLSMHKHFNAIFMNRIRYMFDAANRCSQALSFAILINKMDWKLWVVHVSEVVTFSNEAFSPSTASSDLDPWEKVI